MDLLKTVLPFLECFWIDDSPQLLFFIIICYQLQDKYQVLQSSYPYRLTQCLIVPKEIKKIIDLRGYEARFKYFYYQKYKMLNSQKLYHIVIPLFLSILYSGFIIQIQHPSDSVFVYLAIYYFLFLLYTLKTYTIFHYPPSQPNYHSVNFDANLIFKYKLVQQKRAEVQYQLGQAKKDKDQLLQQYANLMKSSSFCDACEKVQPPRSYHCYFCDVCILKKHFHSKAIGFCIGQSNQMPYLMYLLISKYLSLYAFISLILTQLLYRNGFQKLQASAEIIFFVVLLTFMSIFFYYFNQSLSMLSLLQKDLSFAESQNKYLPKNQPLFQNDTKKSELTYTQCLLEVIKCKSMGDISYWSSQAEQLYEQR